jgi:hypothetical protein
MRVLKHMVAVCGIDDECTITAAVEDVLKTSAFP